MELLALLAVLIAGYAAAGLVYRRYLRRRLPDKPSPPAEVEATENKPDPPSNSQDPRDGTSENGVHCPACGAANEDGFARCYNCANPLPGG